MIWNPELPLPPPLGLLSGETEANRWVWMVSLSLLPLQRCCMQPLKFLPLKIHKPAADFAALGRLYIDCLDSLSSQWGTLKSPGTWQQLLWGVCWLSRSPGTGHYSALSPREYPDGSFSFLWNFLRWLKCYPFLGDRPLNFLFHCDDEALCSSFVNIAWDWSFCWAFLVSYLIWELFWRLIVRSIHWCASLCPALWWMLWSSEHKWSTWYHPSTATDTGTGQWLGWGALTLNLLML